MNTKKDSLDSVYVDYARSLFESPEKLQQERAILMHPEPEPVVQGQRGISVIMPTYGGRDRILASLSSLAGQTLARDLFEVVVVANGPDDGTSEVIEASRRTALGGIAVRLIRTRSPGAGNARNLGLIAARHDYITFLDDDDSVTPNFLSELYKIATPTTVALSMLRSLDSNGEEIDESALESRIRALTPVSPRLLNEVPWTLGFNAGKLIHRGLLAGVRYAPHLRSGEDVAFFAHLLRRPEIDIARVPDDPDAAYLRTVRQGSVSRQRATFDFNVLQRLEVISELESLDIPDGAPARALGELVRAQAGFIARYQERASGDWARITSAIHAKGVNKFPWDMLNRERPRELAICYCFAPFMDTSAVVATKIVASRARAVDVISNDMSRVRTTDPGTWAIAAEWVGEFRQLSVPAAFNNWDRIAEFGREALREAEALDAKRGGYESLYSRALWIGSHVAAILFKLRHWSVRWTAEFSDPLRSGVDGTQRIGPIVPNDVSSLLYKALESRGFATAGIETLFDLVEFATYATADELIFTNVNQRDEMLEAVPDEKLRACAQKKSVIRPHPEPPEFAYTLSSSALTLPSGVANIGYFGAFYPNRGIDEVLVALSNLETRVRRRVRLHVFSNSADSVTKRVAELGLTANVYSRGYVPYTEFLNLARRFEVLIVGDVHTGDHSRNVFLPSKISDYRGAGVPIWALAEHGSALDAQETDYKSEAGSSVSAVAVLTSIVEDFDKRTQD